MTRNPLPAIPFLVLLLCTNTAGSTEWQTQRTKGTYEALMGLLEENDEPLLVSSVDLDKVKSFQLRPMRPGLHFLYSGRHFDAQQVDQTKQIVFLIHGVDEPGPNWDTALRLLVRKPGLLVFYFVWTKWNRPHSVEYWIGHDISRLAKALSKYVPQMDVVAHSAGGVLLLQALCRPDSSRLCAYKKTEFPDLAVKFHTIASPLGGFGMRSTAMASPFAGAVTAHIGSNVYYWDMIPDIDLTVWFTSYETDKVLKKQQDRDMRFPQFTGQAPDVQKQALEGCSHDGAILHGLARIFHIPRPKDSPVEGPWQTVYKDVGDVTPYRPPPPDPGWQPVEPVDDSWKAVDPDTGEAKPEQTKNAPDGD